MGRMGTAPTQEPMALVDRRLLSVAAVCGLAALLMTFYVAWHGTPLPGDVDTARWFQDRALVNRFERPINALGWFPVQLCIAILGMALAAIGPRLALSSATVHERTLAVWALIIALVLRMASSPLKAMAQSDRPSARFGLHVAREFPGFGFPSGHVLSDVIIYGMLAVISPAILGRTLGATARVFCLVVLLLAGPARIAVGAHWPSDVIGGYLWGLAGLCAGLVLARKLAAR